MHRAPLFILLLLLTPLVANAASGDTLAVTGTNGWTATEVFRSSDLAEALPEWSALGVIRLIENGAHQTIAETSAGGFYVRPIVQATTSYGVWTGVVHYDGTTFRTVLREKLDYGNGPPGSIGPLTGTKILDVYAVPAGTDGFETDDLLVARYDADEATVELLRYPAAGDSTPPVDTTDPDVLFTWSAGLSPQASVAADASGNLYVAATGLLGSSGESLDGTIRELSRDSALNAYSDSALIGNVARFVTVEGNRVYAVGASGSAHAGEVLRIDPDTGETAVFSSWPTGNQLSAWAWDASGSLQVDLRDSFLARGYVTEAPAFDSTSFDARIADVPYYSPTSLEKRRSGGLYVAAETLGSVKYRGSVSIYHRHDTVWQLVYTGSSGDDGSAGGGKGNGKGRGHNK